MRTWDRKLGLDSQWSKRKKFFFCYLIRGIIFRGQWPVSKRSKVKGCRQVGEDANGDHFLHKHVNCHLLFFLFFRVYLFWWGFNPFEPILCFVTFKFNKFRFFQFLLLIKDDVSMVNESWRGFGPILFQNPSFAETLSKWLRNCNLVIRLMHLKTSMISYSKLDRIRIRVRGNLWKNYFLSKNYVYVWLMRHCLPKKKRKNK